MQGASGYVPRSAALYWAEHIEEMDMVEKDHAWRKRVRKPVEVAVITIFLALVVVVIIGYIWKWGWTGLSQKTLWHWLQLLIIPVVLAVGGYLFDYTTSRTEREVAIDRQRQEAVQTFVDKISELLLHEDLRDENYKGEARTIVRAMSE